MSIYQAIAPMVQGVVSGRGALQFYDYLNYYEFIEVSILDGDKQFCQSNMFYKIRYQAVTRLDTENFLEPCEYNEKLLIPTVERALVDFMLDTAIDLEDEDLMFAMQVYNDKMCGDMTKLLSVAEFYGVQGDMERVIENSKDWDKFAE